MSEKRQGKRGKEEGEAEKEGSRDVKRKKTMISAGEMRGKT